MENTKIALSITFLVLIIVSALIVRPLFTAIALGAILAYLCYPVYTSVNKKVKRNWLSALLVMFLVALIVTLPLFLVAGTISREAYQVYQGARLAVSEPGYWECTPEKPFACATIHFLSVFSSDEDLAPQDLVVANLAKLGNTVLTYATNFLFELPQIFFQIFVMFFMMFFFLIDGPKAVDFIQSLFPANEKTVERMTKQFDGIMYGTLYGLVLVSIIQGLIAMAGYAIFSVQSAFFWGLISIIAAFIPFVGVALIWVPLAAQKIVAGINGTAPLYQGVGLLIFGVLIISLIDNIVKPKIIGHHAQVHPGIVLVGVFGGLALFGFPGLIIGPVILTITIAALEVYADAQ